MSQHGILPSPTHGMNPTVSKCEACGRTNGILLMGYRAGDEAAPASVSAGFCGACDKNIKSGLVVIIEVVDLVLGAMEFHRTGRLWYVPAGNFQHALEMTDPCKYTFIEASESRDFLERLDVVKYEQFTICPPALPMTNPC